MILRCVSKGWLVIGLLFLVQTALAHSHDHEHDDDLHLPVTCGSAVKLRHVSSKYLLHSHAIDWGSGSGQQSVTGFKEEGDSNSLWSLREGVGQEECSHGQPISCGSVIRLSHVPTGRYLHSHPHRSPLSGRQEVSGYGGGDQTNTDDNWRVECVAGGVNWLRGSPIALRHVPTGALLYTRRSDEFTPSNCPGCPIVNQLEISAHAATSYNDGSTHWITADGYFMAPTSTSSSPSKQSSTSGKTKDEL